MANAAHVHDWKRRGGVYIDGHPLYVCECGAEALDESVVVPDAKLVKTKPLTDKSQWIETFPALECPRCGTGLDIRNWLQEAAA